MKIIKYNLYSIIEPNGDILFYSTKTMPWSAANEEIAKKEAYKGEYIITDDGVEELAAQPTLEERTAALEEAINLLLEGATE